MIQKAHLVENERRGRRRRCFPLSLKSGVKGRAENFTVPFSGVDQTHSSFARGSGPNGRMQLFSKPIRVDQNRKVNPEVWMHTHAGTC